MRKWEVTFRHLVNKNFYCTVGPIFAKDSEQARKEALEAVRYPGDWLAGSIVEIV